MHTGIRTRAESAQTRKVLICKSVLLQYSETFILEQLHSYADWAPILVGLRRLEAGLPLERAQVLLLYGSKPTLLHDIIRKGLGEVGLSPPGFFKRLRQVGASVVHTHFATEAVAFWPVVRRLGCPLVVTLHGSDINIYRESWERGERGFGNRRYPERVLSLSRNRNVYFVAVSNAIKRRATEYGIPPERITVRHTGIDLERFTFSGVPVIARRRRILFIGRFVEKKGGEYLLRAYARIRNGVPEAELTMVGDGPLRKRFEQLAVELQIPVRFPGALGAVQVKREIDEARVLCLPSVTARNGDAEGFGMVLLEAQACGVPVVTSARGGAEEGVIDGKTGFAFAERDVDTLSERLTRILTDDDLALSMSEEARPFVKQRFDIRRCTRSLEQLYDEITGVVQ
jgi:glycosyltransferase involved in cell wall biosynthesis